MDFVCKYLVFFFSMFHPRRHGVAFSLDINGLQAALDEFREKIRKAKPYFHSTYELYGCGIYVSVSWIDFESFFLAYAFEANANGSKIGRMDFLLK